jgi:molecular chaperone Hsp33
MMQIPHLQQDLLHRFIFEHTPIRGNTVHIQHSMQQALQHQACPPQLRQWLGELMVASVMLAATLKLENGALILQIQGKGALKLLVVECNADLTIRATAKWKEGISELSFAELVGSGHFVITLDPKDGGQPYQGIVPVEGDSIAEILQNYMQRSEQIDTRIWLSCDGHSAAGLLVQKLPNEPEQDSDAWNRIGYLADTVKDHELLGLPAEPLLKRLFFEEDVRLFAGEDIRFNCSCSRASVGNMLRMLGEEEVTDILAEQGQLEVHCDFCNAAYQFDPVDVEQLWLDPVAVPSSKTRH